MIYVCLRVGGEKYALPAANVREVAALGTVSAMPGAPSFALGIRNLHGEVLPVFDLAMLLGSPDAEPVPQRLLVAEHDARRGGFAVDDVSDVRELPAATEDTESEYLVGAAVADDGLVGFIDVARLFAGVELGA